MYLIKCTQKFLLKNQFFMFLANIIFVISDLKINPAINLNTLEALSHCSQKETFFKSFIILMF